MLHLPHMNNLPSEPMILEKLRVLAFHQCCKDAVPRAPILLQHLISNRVSWLEFNYSRIIKPPKCFLNGISSFSFVSLRDLHQIRSRISQWRFCALWRLTHLTSPSSVLGCFSLLTPLDLNLNDTDANYRIRSECCSASSIH